MVELRGLEPLTPTLPVWCATSCATAPSIVRPVARTTETKAYTAHPRHRAPAQPAAQPRDPDQERHAEQLDPPDYGDFSAEGHTGASKDTNNHEET